MKEKRIELSRLYHAALQEYLKQASEASTKSAWKLGHQAMTLGLETLDMARIHEIALVSLVLPGYSSSTGDGLMGRAGMFFAEAITPLEETHRGAREANAHLKAMIDSLTQRSAELAAANKMLQDEIVQRIAVEESLRTSELTTSLLLGKSRQMQEELRQLSRELLTVQEEERRKISRELHDVIAQTLTSINVGLAALKTESTANTKEFQKKIASTQKLVEKSVDIVHHFARELRPTVLDDLGLIPALEAFMKGFMKDTGIRVSLTAFAEVEIVDNAKHTALYRVAKEALTNVARHSKATCADVSIKNIQGVIHMEIKDDGQGFAVDGNMPAKKSNRLGLLGMRERIEMVGGTFCVESAPGKGTTVRAEIPSVNNRAGSVPKHKTGDATTLECP
jgi:signal transduction histidine kinase